MNADEVAPLDPRALDELRAQVGDAVTAKVLAAYLAELPRHLGDMRAGVERGDAPAVFRAAHSLKGASRIIGGEELASRCRAVEEATRDGVLDGVAGRVAEIEALVPAVEDAVRAHLPG